MNATRKPGKQKKADSLSPALVEARLLCLKANTTLSAACRALEIEPSYGWKSLARESKRGEAAVIRRRLIAYLNRRIVEIHSNPEARP